MVEGELNAVKSANSTLSLDVKFLHEVLPDDLILRAECFPSSREAECSQQNSSHTLILPHAHFHFRICPLIMLQGIRLFNLAPVRNINTYILGYFPISQSHHDGINMYRPALY